MKKSILFVIDSLECAGAEKSLVTLLSLLDYSKFNVDLMLFGHGGALESLVPNEVHILKPLSYTKFANMGFIKAFSYSLRNSSYRMLFARIKYTIRLRRRIYSNPEKARLYWESVGKVIEKSPKEYDVAISYAQGVPTFYVSEKVKAKKKFAWINTSYNLNQKEKEFQLKFYEQFNKIIAVSDSAKQIIKKTFPCCSKKIDIIYDISNPNLIQNLARTGKGLDNDFGGIKILTIGRLAAGKGYDMALEACKLLKERGINFKWYVLGKGPLKQEIEYFISQNNLSDAFILLGVKANPYPFLKSADIYVQTSRFEGFGLALAEARMLNIPIVTTRFDAVFTQMINERNGLVVDMNPNAIVDGIIRLIKDAALRQNIVSYLKTEKKGNIEEVNKFYQLIS